MKPANFFIALIFATAIQAQPTQRGMWLGIEGGVATPIGHELVASGSSVYVQAEYNSSVNGLAIPINLGVTFGLQQFSKNDSTLGILRQIPYGLYINTNIFRWFSTKLEFKPGIFVGTYAGDFSVGQYRSETLLGLGMPLQIVYHVSDDFSVSGTFRPARVFGFPYYLTDPNDIVGFTLGINYFIPLQ